MLGLAAVVEVAEKMAALAAGFDVALVSATDAQRIVEEMSRVEHMAAGLKAAAAAKVGGTELWRRGGDRSPAHYLARRSGTSLTAAQQALDTAAKLAQLPQLEQAVRRGQVSPAQAGAIADAAGANPGAEGRLLQTARQASLGELKDECARTKAAAQRDAEARHRALHASRYLRHRRCADGAGELTYRSTAEEVAEVLAVIRGFGDEAFRLARAEGRREAEEAYLADGLLEMARSAAGAELGRTPLVAAGAEADVAAGGDGQPLAEPTGQPPMPSDGGMSGGGGPTDHTRRASATSGGRPTDHIGPSQTGGGTSDRRPDFGPLIEVLREMGEHDEAARLATGAETERGQGGDAPLRAGPRAGGGRRGATTGPVPAGSGAGGGGAVPPSGGGGPPPAEPDRAARRGTRRRRVPAQIVVHIDWDALVRGWPIEGERSEIAGVGPVPVSVVEAMMASGDALLAAVVQKGQDLVCGANLGRRPTRLQKAALGLRSGGTCTVEGCNASVRLEHDHRTPWAECKVTLVGAMDCLCSHHHDLKTFQGWALVEGVGTRPMVAPDDPRHPRNVATATVPA